MDFGGLIPIALQAVRLGLILVKNGCVDVGGAWRVHNNKLVAAARLAKSAIDSDIPRPYRYCPSILKLFISGEDESASNTELPGNPIFSSSWTAYFTAESGGYLHCCCMPNTRHLVLFDG